MPDILELFKNPETFSQLSLGERFIGSLYVILLGMGIVFSALVILMLATYLMSVVLRGSNQPKAAPAVKKSDVAASTPAPEAPAQAAGANASAPVAARAAVTETEADDEELVAVIAAAIAASLNKSVSDLVVTRIRRLPETAPTWMLQGRAEAMNNR